LNHPLPQVKTSFIILFSSPTKTLVLALFSPNQNFTYLHNFFNPKSLSLTPNPFSQCSHPLTSLNTNKKMIIDRGQCFHHDHFFPWPNLLFEKCPLYGPILSLVLPMCISPFIGHIFFSAAFPLQWIVFFGPHSFFNLISSPKNCLLPMHIFTLRQHLLHATSSPSCKIFFLGHILSLTPSSPKATRTTSSSQPHLLLKIYLLLQPHF